MPPTDVSERGLESLIVDRLTGLLPPLDTAGAIRDERGLYRAGGYVAGSATDYDRLHAVDTAKLLDFLRATQPKIVEQLDLETDGPSRLKFLDRLQGEIAKKGVIEVLRQGVKHGPAQVDLFYGKPTPGNVAAAGRFAANVFSVTRQLRYSPDETARALDLVLFINGLPVATFELKGKASWFLPFNKGWNDGRGNPPNPHGLKTAYLWETVLSRESLTDIIENYAQVVTEKDEKGQKRERQVFPRYHQLDVVRKLLAHANTHGAGHRYLIQHSAGSGKSNSIAWLAHQLIDLQLEVQLQAHLPDGMQVNGDPIVASLNPKTLSESQKAPLPLRWERHCVGRQAAAGRIAGCSAR